MLFLKMEIYQDFLKIFLMLDNWF